jgi:hypothetical protein
MISSSTRSVSTRLGRVPIPLRAKLWGLMVMAMGLIAGCRTWNYTAEDLEREGRLMSGHGTEPCPGGCWHTAHGFQPGYPIRSGGRHGP